MRPCQLLFSSVVSVLVLAPPCFGQATPLPSSTEFESQTFGSITISGIRLYHELIDTDVGKRHHFKVDCQIQESDGSALFEGIDIAFVLKDAKGDAFESIYTKGLRLLPQQITPCELDNADRLTDPPDVAHVAVEASVNRLYSFPASNLKKK